MGPVAIEDLYPGDLVDTVNGDPMPVTWIGSTSFVPAQALLTSSFKGLMRLVADGYSKPGALGYLLLGRNTRFLQSSPALKEKIGISAVLTSVRDLENGFSAFLVSPPKPCALVPYSHRKTRGGLCKWTRG